MGPETNEEEGESTEHAEDNHNTGLLLGKVGALDDRVDGGNSGHFDGFEMGIEVARGYRLET